MFILTEIIEFFFRKSRFISEQRSIVHKNASAIIGIGKLKGPTVLIEGHALNKRTMDRSAI